MRARPAALLFDWSNARLNMDLPVFVYSHMKIGLLPYEDWLKLSFKTGKIFRAAFYLVTDLSTSTVLQTTQRNLIGLLFCLDLSLSRSTDRRNYNFHSLSHRFQSSCI